MVSSSLAGGLTLLASLLLRPAAGIELPSLGGVHAVLHFPQHPGFSLPVGERVRAAHPPPHKRLPLGVSATGHQATPALRCLPSRGWAWRLRH
jgi:hypothetical protein